MQIVQQTILQFTAIVGLVFAMTWLLMGVLMGMASRAAKLFTAANLALVVGVVLTGLRTPEPGYLYYHLADWVTIVGFACLHRGLLHLIDVDRPPALHSVFPLLLAVLTTALFDPGPTSATVMSLALLGTTAWYAFTAFMDGMRGLDAEVFAKAARAGVSAPFFLMGLVLVARTLDVLGSAIFGVAYLPAVDNPVFFLWAMVVFMLLANIALATLATGRLVMRIRSLAEMDYLTGCLNRRSLEQRMRIEQDRNLRSGEPLACVFFDLDHFKRINDEYGHEAGDAALKHTVRLIADLLRSVDALGRFGGEEFMVLMPNTDLKGATDAANRMRLALMRTKLEIQGKVIPLSASFGAAVLGRNERPDDLVRRADAAMYEAKRLGRNRVEVDASQGV
jgi:diguanylate cyclase (GGDEF)-like protein